LDLGSRALIHPVLAFELGNNAVNRAFHTERLAAANTSEWFLFLESAGYRGGGAEIELRFERDYLLWAGRFAESALHAGILGKPQHRPLGIVRQRPGRAGRHAGEAQGAAVDIDLNGAERRV